MGSVLQSASRESLKAATARLDAHVDDTGASDLTRLASDLFAVLSLLEREHALRRALADSATPAASRTGLADRLLSGKVGRPALDLVSDLVSSRWSRSSDLVEALRRWHAARVRGSGKGRLARPRRGRAVPFGRILDRASRSRAVAVGLRNARRQARRAAADVAGEKVAPSPPRCWSRPCAPRAQPQPRRGGRGALRSCRGRAATATSPTSAPPSG